MLEERWSEIPTLPKAVADWIATGIINGRWAEGDRLNEVAIAGELNVSRAPVREAIRMLQAGGFVDHRQRLGAVVKAFSQQTIRNVYAIRAKLEPWIIRESIPTLSDDARDALRAVQRQIREAGEKGDGEAVFDHGWRFREIAYSGFSNPLAIEIVSQLRQRLHSLPQVLRREPSYLAANIDFYERLTEQIMRNAADEAGETIARFLVESGELMCQVFSRGEPLDADSAASSVTST
jgi:DNA-binding GntR family transcriptional regulator